MGGVNLNVLVIKVPVVYWAPLCRLYLSCWASRSVGFFTGSAIYFCRAAGKEPGALGRRIARSLRRSRMMSAGCGPNRGRSDQTLRAAAQACAGVAVVQPPSLRLLRNRATLIAGGENQLMRAERSARPYLRLQRSSSLGGQNRVRGLELYLQRRW